MPGARQLRFFCFNLIHEVPKPRNHSTCLALSGKVKAMTERDLNKTPDVHPPAAILVVDDDPILRSTLAFEIRDAGYQVREASNTDEAEQILSTGAPIDVVVTDIEMPGPRDGLALAKSVRAFRPHIKVIVASGAIPRTGVVGVADAFFGKPYDFSRILMRIRSLLHTSPRAADPA